MYVCIYNSWIIAVILASTHHMGKYVYPLAITCGPGKSLTYNTIKKNIRPFLYNTWYMYIYIYMYMYLYKQIGLCMTGELAKGFNIIYPFSCGNRDLKHRTNVWRGKDAAACIHWCLGGFMKSDWWLNPIIIWGTVWNFIRNKTESLYIYIYIYIYIYTYTCKVHLEIWGLTD